MVELPSPDLLLPWRFFLPPPHLLTLLHHWLRLTPRPQLQFDVSEPVETSRGNQFLPCAFLCSCPLFIWTSLCPPLLVFPPNQSDKLSQCWFSKATLQETVEPLKKIRVYLFYRRFRFRSHIMWIMQSEYILPLLSIVGMLSPASGLCIQCPTGAGTTGSGLITRWNEICLFVKQSQRCTYTDSVSLSKDSFIQCWCEEKSSKRWIDALKELNRGGIYRDSSYVWEEGCKMLCEECECCASWGGRRQAHRLYHYYNYYCHSCF